MIFLSEALEPFESTITCKITPSMCIRETMDKIFEIYQQWKDVRSSGAGYRVYMTSDKGIYCFAFDVHGELEPRTFYARVELDKDFMLDLTLGI